MISGAPGVLVVDDDPVSLGFLRAAIESAGCAVSVASGAPQALAAARACPPDLLVIDRGLPQTDGPTLLQRLRGEGIAAPAIATSAQLDSGDRHALLAAGFADTLVKPSTLAAITAMVGRFVCVQPIAAASVPVPANDAILDDGPALAAVGGDRATLAALRRLFAAEVEALVAGAGDPSDPRSFAERLHRLRASCGFCGAAALGAAAARYEEVLRRQPDGSDAERRAFVDACLRTTRALADLPHDRG